MAMTCNETYAAGAVLRAADVLMSSAGGIVGTQAGHGWRGGGS
jgi:hypothetical protein